MSAYAPSIEGVSLWTMEREEDIPAARTRLVKTRGTLCKVADRIGRVKISGLCFAGSDQMSGCKIRPLYIVEQNAVAGNSFKIGVQKDNWDRNQQSERNVSDMGEKNRKSAGKCSGLAMCKGS